MAKELSKKIIDFAKNGAAVVGKGRLGLAAAAAMATSATIALAFNVPTADVATPSQEASAGMAASIQKHLDEEMPGLRIAVVDLDSDVATIEQLELRGDFDCVVYSALRPTDQVMGIDDLGDASIESFSRFMVYTDVATCLGADDPAYAKAFGLMMSSLTTSSEDFPRLMAAYSELQELRGNAHASEHWSATAWNVATAMESEGFLSIANRDMLSAYNLAFSMPVQQDAAAAEAFAKGFRDSMMKTRQFVQVEGGIMAVLPSEWMALTRDDVKPIDRFLELFDYMHATEGRWDLRPQALDFAEARQSLEELGQRGNSGARAIAAAMGSSIDFDYEPYVKVSEGFSPDAISGVMYDIVPEGMFVVYDADQKGFAISDAERRPVAVGVAKGFPGVEDRKGEIVRFSQPDLDFSTKLASR